MSGSLGMSKSSNQSVSNPDKVWGEQAPFLQDLYGRAQSQLDAGTGQQYGQQFMDPALQTFQQQAAGGQQGQDWQRGLQNMALGGQQNQALDSAIQSGLGQMNRNFQRNIMPGISQGAVGAGTSGGSRQGIAEGLAMSDANQQASDFVNRMQSENFANVLQSQGQAYGQLQQGQGLQNQAQQAAMQMAPGLSNLGFGNQYGDLMNFANLIGGPTVLGQGGSSSGKSFGFNTSGGLK